MKKSLLLLASMLLSTVSVFAQWTKPVPAFQKMVDDGNTPMYLYNIEAGGFFIGANDYMTRASISYSDGAKVKMTQIYEDPETLTGPLGTWAIVDSVAKFNEYRKTFADNASAIWVDNNSGSHCDEWVVTALGENKYEISNPGAATGKLVMFKTLDGAANTRLFLFDPNEESWLDNNEQPRYTDPCSTWTFVTIEDFEAIVPKIAQYNAAMTLQAAIENGKAKYPQADFSAAEAFYNNTSSTVEELDSATNKLVPQAIANFQKLGASADNPADFTDLVPNADFEKGIDGWQFTTGAQNKGQATNKGVQNDYPGTTITGNFLENWNPNVFAGKIYTELSNLPDGVYKVTMDATTNGGQDTWVYANNDSIRTGGVDCNGEGGKEMGDVAYKFSLFTIVGEDGKLELGLRNNTDCCNWIGIDNVTLTYYGAEVDAFKFWYNETRANLIATMDAMVTDDTKYDKTQKDVFYAALEKGDAAASKDEIMEAVAGLTSAANATMASISAYTELQKQCEIIETELSDLGDVMDLVLLFSDFFRADEEGAAEDAINELKESSVPAEDIVEVAPYLLLEVCDMPTDEVVEYTNKLVALFKYCLANSITPGMDFTSLITDANFTDANGKGWSQAIKAANLAWTGGISSFPVAESYHSKFDIYQEVDAADGIYSLSLNGFCRLDDGVDTEVPAEIYLNDFATPLVEITQGKLPKDQAIDGVNCYLTNGTGGAWEQNPKFQDKDGNPVSHKSPNDATDSSDDEGYWPNGMEGASVAFSADRYKATVYGIVEGGKMKLGVRNTKSEHIWALWANFKLTYEGVNETAVNALAETFVENANNYMEANGENMTDPVNAGLNAAIAAVTDADEAQAKYDAIKALNATLATARENVEAVVKFVAAQDAMNAAADDYSETANAAAMAQFDALKDVTFSNLDNAALAEYTAKFEACTAALRIPNTEGASDANAIDMTQVIINPDFQANTAGQQATGWTLVKGEGASGNYQVQNGFDGGVSMEFWSNTTGSGTKYDFYQDIANLPAGTYELIVDAANSYNGQQPGPGEGYACVYAATGNGEEFVYGTAAIETQIDGCADSHKSYSVIVVLKEGETLRLGSKNIDELSARWVMIDNFQLKYYGTESQKQPSVDAIESNTVIATVSAIYNVAGQKVDKLAKGINIIKMSDNSVRKVLVK